MQGETDMPKGNFAIGRDLRRIHYDRMEPSTKETTSAIAEFEPAAAFLSWGNQSGKESGDCSGRRATVCTLTGLTGTDIIPAGAGRKVAREKREQSFG
jgi:hypothetical protein